jgi:hypothetical protein
MLFQDSRACQERWVVMVAAWALVTVAALE